MSPIEPRPLPAGAFLKRYVNDGGYTDCFAADIPGLVSLPQFVEAFYSSEAFKLELLTVGLLFARPSSDALAGELARGEVNRFSAWEVEDRDDRQLLMRETISDKTRSWLMVEPLAGPAPRTRIYFGTAILPVGRRSDGSPRMSVLFALVGFHKAYARLLLAGAARGLVRGEALFR